MTKLDSYKHSLKNDSAFPTSITIDLAARYASAFGMRAATRVNDKVFITQKSPDQYELEFYNSPSYLEDFEKTKLEIVGVNEDVLEFGSVLNGKNGSVFAAPLFFTISQKKNHVISRVNDSDSVVIERWGTDPWNISMQGLLIDLSNRIYPSDEIRRLNRFWQKNEIVKVSGVQFEELDIDHIYLHEISFKRANGFQDSIEFALKGNSLKAVNFTLLNNE